MRTINMRPDNSHLAAFYGSPRGRVAARLIKRRLGVLTPPSRDLVVLGLGYAGPFLGGFTGKAARVIAFSPHEQGEGRWPSFGPNCCAVVQETTLPLADRSVDVAVLAHAIEGTDRVHRLLREIWRVLADAGRLIVIVPNRRGIWCLVERTPFGHGRPYSATQLRSTLETNLFTPLRHERALYMPPFRSKVLLRTAPLWEGAGSRVARKLSGVIMVEAEKSVMAGTPVLARADAHAPNVYALPPRRHAAARTASQVKVQHDRPRTVAFTSRRERD